jgi:hypothetical protein
MSGAASALQRGAGPGRQGARPAAAVAAAGRRAAAPAAGRGRERAAPRAPRASPEQQQQAPVQLEELELAVPSEQRPCNELAQLKQAWLYSWATLPQGDYVKRLGILFAFFGVTISGPISYVTFDPAQDVSGCSGRLLWGGEQAFPGEQLPPPHVRRPPRRALRCCGARGPSCAPALPPPTSRPRHGRPPGRRPGGPALTRPHPPLTQTAEFILSSAVGSLVVVSVACIRIYLGWDYVAKRLFSAAVPYEETGWCGGRSSGAEQRE